MKGNSSPTCWALLIGINYYPDDDETSPLEGCVRDVEQLQQHFEGRENIHTTLLTASFHSEVDSKKPFEDENQLPTLENIRSSINRIISKANTGDLVHIHFSGHGVRRKTQSEDFGDHENGDLALVLYDPISNVRYLQGLELARRLEEMVDKGLKPVLVLDCCHSGAILRDGRDQNGKIREAVYNAEIDRQSSSPDLPRKKLTFKAPKRDATACPNWFLDPDGYAILTACGPNEISRELTFNDGNKSGPLSHFLLLALRSMQRRNASISLKSIHGYVTVQFHAGFVKQNPRRYGNQNTCLLSHLELSHDPLEARVRWHDSELILEAGQVHAVAENDEYRIQAPWNDCQKPTIRVICKVKTVNAFTSVLEAVNPDTDVSLIKTAWRAVPCTHLSNRHIAVKLSSQLQHDQWQKVIAASNFLKLSVGLQNVSPPLSGVCIDIKDESKYQILDERMCEIPGLPTISMASPSAISNTVNVLDHVAKFKYIERLENRVPNLGFEQSIKMQLADSNGHAVDSMGSLHVSHGENVELRCLNLSKKPAYLSVFNLTPLWRIENILTKKYGDYKDLSPAESGSTQHVASTKPLKITMKIPEVLEHLGECDDVIKIFVTSRPVLLSSLRLPALSLSERIIEPATRSSEQSLMKLLEYLSPITRGSGNTMTDECWLTRNFVIHVSK